MPRQLASATENNFRNALVTEASGLNFPENACTETYDCVFNYDGSVQRRPGFDFEANYETKAIDRTSKVVNTYLWKNVAGNGDVTLFVVQIGATLYFYETPDAAISPGQLTSTIALTDFDASGAPGTETLECQFSSGNGLLFVTHPYCDPFYVSYDTVAQTVSGTAITLQIRDLAGVDDSAVVTAIDNRPTASLAGLTVSHKYNLYNQGWNTTNLTAWDTSQTTMPSNADVMWAFKNSSDVFDMTTILNVVNGNSQAPRGHFILALCNQDRDTASGLSGTTATTTSYQRPSTSAFFAGRVFYAGINYIGFNSTIYFSQIAETNAQYGFCYQKNDPTAEDAFDLLPSDGGYIKIPEAGTIYKIFSIVGALIVFAANGVWTISGSSGLGFLATDYVVSKISSVSTISACSFVDVNGVPAWWNIEGIFMLTSGPQGGVTVQPMVLSKIKAFYDDIPTVSKRTARGFYNKVTNILQWIYKSTAGTTPTDTYEFDRVLNYNVRTEAFYPWTVSDSDVTVNGLFVIDAESGQLVVENVSELDGTTLVTNDAGAQVVNFTATTSNVTPVSIFLVSYPSGGSYAVTFGQANNTDYVDWSQYGDDTQYTSYFITGYKLHGGGIRKFQTNYVKLFSRNDTDTEYYFQGLWDYATTGSGTGRWSQRQTVTHSDAAYSTLMRRLKVRGAGIALQFKVTSSSSNPFDVIGWSTQESANASV